MRAVICLAAVLAAPVFASPAQSADATTILVVPGRPGVPVMYFGRDISWGVVEGEMGLDRPGSPVTIIPGSRPTYWGDGVGGYFPSTGQPPRSGRLEIEPPADRPLPPPAESYHREWGVESAHTPVTIPAPYDTPPVVIGPQAAPPRPKPAKPVPHAP